MLKSFCTFEAWPKKEQTVNEMLLEIEMGITYSECMKLNERLWKLPETTYNRYWSEASKRYKARLDAIEDNDEGSGIDGS